MQRLWHSILIIMNLWQGDGIFYPARWRLMDHFGIRDALRCIRSKCCFSRWVLWRFSAAGSKTNGGESGLIRLGPCVSTSPHLGIPWDDEAWMACHCKCEFSSGHMSGSLVHKKDIPDLMEAPLEYDVYDQHKHVLSWCKILLLLAQQNQYLMGK